MRSEGIRKWLARFRWGWVIGLVTVGLLITLVAFLPRYLVGVPVLQSWAPWIWLDKDDLPVVQSVITNVGTAFITAGLLALFEPLLTRHVRAEAKAAASAATKSLGEELGHRLDTLEQRVGASLAEEVEQQDQAITAAEQEFGYKTVYKLLKKAEELQALADAEITVQGTDVPGELTLSLGFEYIKNVFDRGTIGTTHVLFLRADSVLTDIAEPVQVTWSPTDDFDVVASRLLVEMSKAGAGVLDNIPWQRVTERFTGALTLAIRSRRRDRDLAPLGGRLREVVGEHWFITDKGLNCPTFGLWVDAESWPPIRADGGLGGTRVPAAEKPPAADQAEWDYVMDRCDHLFAANLDARGNRLFL